MTLSPTTRAVSRAFTSANPDREYSLFPSDGSAARRRTVPFETAVDTSNVHRSPNAIDAAIGNDHAAADFSSTTPLPSPVGCSNPDAKDQCSNTGPIVAVRAGKRRSCAWSGVDLVAAAHTPTTMDNRPRDIARCHGVMEAS
jgi:hypothetical protein